MRILAIGAHPDDLEYGCGGALLRHVQRGDQVHLAIVTDGSQGGDPELRRQEQREAARTQEQQRRERKSAGLDLDSAASGGDDDEAVEETDA